MSEDQKTEQEKRLAEATAKAEEVNKGKTGRGTRQVVGQTRGRNPQVITYEEFDKQKPETLPETLDEFMKLTATNDEKVILGYVLDGFNDAAYREASDPVAEFIESSWPDEIKKNFRVIVRNYAAMLGLSIEDAANAVKPNVMKGLAEKK